VHCFARFGTGLGLSAVKESWRLPVGVVMDGCIGNGIGVTGVDLCSFQWLGHVRFDIHEAVLPVNTCGKSSN